MIQKNVIAVLRAAVDEHSPVAVEQSVKSVDPLIRWWVRRRVVSLLERSKEQVETVDELVALRVAFLLASKGKLESSFEDKAGLQAEFENAFDIAVAPKITKYSVSLGLLVLLTITSAAVFVFITFRAPFDPLKTPLGHALGEGMPKYFIALSQRGANVPGAPAAVEQASKEILSPVVAKELGDKGQKQLAEVLQAADRMSLGSRQPYSEDVTAGFLASVQGLDNELYLRQVPYFVDADILSLGGRRTPLALSYYVEHENTFEVEGKTHRTLWLWRLDSLNFQQAALGYTRARTPAALVLLDQLEADLVQAILPGLADGEEVELVDNDTRLEKNEWVKEFQLKAGALVRGYFAATPYAQTAAPIGKLLARRRKLVRHWSSDLGELGLVFRVPERLMPEGDYSTQLRRRIPMRELIEWDTIHDDLLSKQNEDVFVQVRDFFTQSVERHELQHRIDFTRDLVPIPAPLAEKLGIQNVIDAPEASLGASARDEMSALLSQVAQGNGAPTIDLLLLARFLLDKGHWGNAYCYSALVIFEQLASELNITAEKMIQRGRVQRQPVGDLVLKLAETPGDQVRAAASRVWAKLYGMPLPETKKLSSKNFVRWRH